MGGELDSGESDRQRVDVLQVPSDQLRDLPVGAHGADHGDRQPPGAAARIRERFPGTDVNERGQ